MGKAILERFNDTEFKYGTNYKDLVKQDTETRLEAELTGIRKEYLTSFLSLYGKESVRIVSQGKVDDDALRNNVVDSITNKLNTGGKLAQKIGGVIGSVNDSVFNNGKVLKPSELIDKNYQFYATQQYEKLIPTKLDRNIVEFRDGITNLKSIVPNAKALAINTAKDAVRGKIGGFIKDKIPAIGNAINDAIANPNAVDGDSISYAPDVNGKEPYNFRRQISEKGGAEAESQRNLEKIKNVSPVSGLSRYVVRNSASGPTAYFYNGEGGTESGDASRDFNTPSNEYSKMDDIRTRSIKTKFGIDNGYDKINMLGVGDRNLDLTIDDDDPIKKQMIPFKITNASNGQYAYFRAALTSFNETVSPSWDSNRFVGNPFTLFSYSGVERSISFNLKMFSYNYAEHQKMWERIKFLTSLAYPASYYSKSGAVISPFIKLTIGDMFRDRRGFIESLTYSVDDSATWEIDNFGENDENYFYTNAGDLRITNPSTRANGKGFRLPHIVDVAITVKMVEQRATTTFNDDDYRKRLYAFDKIQRTSNVGNSGYDESTTTLQRKDAQVVSSVTKPTPPRNIGGS